MTAHLPAPANPSTQPLTEWHSRQETARAVGQPARAGWYADPTGRFDRRYWNGFDWTRHASYNGEALVDPLG